MPLPKQTSHHDLLRKFRSLGWTGPFSGGKHPFMRKGKQKVHIPNPDSKPIGQGLLNEILRQAGISEDDWENV